MNWIDFFCFRENPFGLGADTQFIYPSASFRNGFSSLSEIIKANEGGLVVITGEVGTGKTTLTNAVASEFNQVIRLIDPTASRHEILHHLKTALNASEATIEALLSCLQKHRELKKPCLIFDEAQNLSRELLDLILTLSNLEIDGAKAMLIEIR